MSRLLAEDRKAEIFNAAITVAKHEGFHNLTHGAVSREAGVSRTLVHRYYPIENLKAAVLRYAVRNNLYRIIAQGLIVDHPIARRLPKETKIKAYKALND